jgi:hypothetical protein
MPRLLPAALLVVRRKYLIVKPKPLSAVALILRCRNLTVVPRPMTARSIPAAPLVVRRLV